MFTALFTRPAGKKIIGKLVYPAYILPIYLNDGVYIITVKGDELKLEGDGFAPVTFTNVEHNFPEGDSEVRLKSVELSYDNLTEISV